MRFKLHCGPQDREHELTQITSLNLNGIRSATSKGLEAWLLRHEPDVLCVQEVKAQAVDVEGHFDALAGMKGHFHFAEKKGYSGVGIYSRTEPSDVLIGFDRGEFDAEGRYVELRFDTPKRRLSIISCYFPSGSSGPERQEAKYRFLELIEPHLMKLKKQDILVPFRFLLELQVHLFLEQSLPCYLAIRMQRASRPLQPAHAHSLWGRLPARLLEQLLPLLQ